MTMTVGLASLSSHNVRHASLPNAAKRIGKHDHGMVTFYANESPLQECCAGPLADSDVARVRSSTSKKCRWLDLTTSTTCKLGLDLGLDYACVQASACTCWAGGLMLTLSVSRACFLHALLSTAVTTCVACMVRG